ncbi:hypothetical protein [Streptomyces sp. NPDC093094]|uniref:hypothetical protein n=1 Tax=Streptomyces sp. NPDC093094 TaxID=3366026 RepID=UPI00380F2492
MGDEGQQGDREPAQPAGKGRTPQLEIWCTHMRALVKQAFDTQKKAAAACGGKSETWLSRGLNAVDGNGSTRMPSREFVDVVLAACKVSDEVRERTGKLYMEALATIDAARHADYVAADRAAATEIRCREALRALEDLRVHMAQQAKQHAHEVARLKSKLERCERERAAGLAAAQEREQEWAADLAAAQTRISERTRQLAAERHGRRVDQATIEALRGELVDAHSTIEALRGALDEAYSVVAALREEPCRHEREEAVLAEAIAVTEQALAAEKARAEVVGTPAPGKKTARRESTSGPLALGSAGFVVMVAGALVGLATVMHPEAAAELDWAVVDALRGSAGAGWAALAAAVLGFSALLGAILALDNRGFFPPAHSDIYSEQGFATWV